MDASKCDDALPVARQGVSMQSNGRALHRNGTTQPRRAKCRRQKVTCWPTTPLTREQMAAALRTVDRQDEAVLAIFRHHVERELAASQAWEIARQHGQSTLLTSVRRSINTLTNCRVLERGERIHDGPNGRPERTWRLPRAKAAT